MQTPWRVFILDIMIDYSVYMTAKVSRVKRPRSYITASNLGLLLQKEQNVKWGEGPSGKQAAGKTMEHGKLCWHIFNHK